MFKIQLRLCEEFNLNPFIIRETEAEEVIKLIQRRSYYLNHNNTSTKPQQEVRRRIDPRQAKWLG